VPDLPRKIVYVRLQYAALQVGSVRIGLGACSSAIGQ
jgi:hypothetical protein